MTLQLDDRWLWDFWFAQDGAQTHIFYLQADRSLKDETRRHWNVSIGHAVSEDLTTWQVLPDALRPSEHSGDWDDFTTWTGSIILHDGLWYMFYTGSSHADNGLLQRIGLATSDDLITWTKHPNNPVIEADSRWYELLDLDAWHDQAWRDPYVFRHPDTGQFHALITARSKDGPADARGVIGHAWSEDLLHWEVLPPLTEPGEFGHMEVPQLVTIQGRWYLIFSCPHQQYALARRDRIGDNLQSGTHYMIADQPLGPYRYLTDEYLVGDRTSTLYSGKLIQDRDGQWQFIAFKNYRPDGSFVGELSNAYPLQMMSDGRLKVQLNHTL